MSQSPIFVHVESQNGQLAAISQELLTKARSLSSNVYAFTDSGTTLADHVARFGATKLFHTAGLTDRLSAPTLSAGVAAHVSETEAGAFLFGTTYDGRDVASRLSVKLDTPAVSNIVDIEPENGSLVGVSTILGGEKIVKTALDKDANKIFLVRPKSFEAVEVAGEAPAAEVLELPSVDIGHAGAATIVERVVGQASGPKLSEAAVVVAGGRGLGEVEHFQLVRDLAEHLGAAVGASRAIVDDGWVPYAYQIGQTGEVVKPDVYVACGISGASQHVAGMKDSKAIIAIDSDPEAPIFKLADLGIVGDVHQVLPKLIAALDS